MKAQVQYRFRKIEVPQFATFKENYSEQTKEVSFQTNTQFSFDKDQNVLSSRIDVSMYKDDKPLLKIEIYCYFEIMADSLENIRQDNQYIFDPGLLVQFASLGYGTMRGVIHEKTLNTPLNNFILPPLYYGDIIKTAFAVPI